MKFHFLGGASEVGASCTLLEVAGKKILVDAGIRMQKREGSALPDLTRLQEVGSPDAILLTHAHTDHIGALPLVYLGFPKVPIFTTEPTRSLSRVLLQDSLRIMESRWEQEEEIPLYPPHAVEGMLGRMVTVAVGEPVPVAEGIVATYIPAGHVLGACSITLNTPEGVILFGGDYSVDRQQTVEGMAFPPQSPDVMITESTYGNRIHSNRHKEEERLVAAVAEVVAAKGKVLIPSFALGRAQEVILLLLDAQRRGRIPKFPVFVDGMVKTMCAVYRQFPQFLQSGLRHWVETNGNPFFYPGGAEGVIPPQRELIVKGAPCAIVASSGMLTGGASRYYAEQLVDNPKNAIFITGYQDEESPGRQLLDLADEVKEKGHGILRIGGVTRRVLCRVDRYGLSAHADAGQMLNVVCRMNPKQVVLVHGDESSRQALAQTFPPHMRVHRPGNSESLEFAPFRAARTSSLKEVVYAGLAVPQEPLNLVKLHAALVQKNGPDRRYTVGELAQAWHGQPTPQDTEAVRAAVADTPQLFVPDKHRPFLFTARSAPSRQTSFAAGKAPKSEAGQVVKQAQKLFGRLPGFEKIGTRQEEKLVVLHFEFPERAAADYHELFLQLARDTGWGVDLSTNANRLALARAVKDAVPLSWDVTRVSHFPGEVRVRARVRPTPNATDSDFEQAQQRFFAITGRPLELERTPEPPPPQVLFDEHARMEQNAAYTAIRNALAERDIALVSFGRKGEPAYLELGLVNPKLGDTHADLLARLRQETGWDIRLRTSPIQSAIATRARQLLPVDWLCNAQPAFHLDQALVHFKTSKPPDPDLLPKLSQQLEKETGFRLTATLNR